VKRGRRNRKALEGHREGKDVEILVNNYALIPPSLHPSGVRYEWIRPFDLDSSNFGVNPLREGELLDLLEELGARQEREEQRPEM